MKRRLSVAALLGCALLLPAAAYADPIAVGTTADEYMDPDPGLGCSLREAVKAASANTMYGGCAAGSGAVEDVITLPAGTYALTRSGAAEEMNVSGDLDVEPSGGPLEIMGISGPRPTIDANGAATFDRAIDIHQTDAFALTHVRLTGGAATGAGGAIRWSGPATGDLTVTDSALDGNAAASAGAIEATTSGTHLIESSSVADNVSSALAQIHSSGDLRIVRSSVTGGTAGGVSAEGTGPNSLFMDSSTVADNNNSDTQIGGMQIAGDAEIVNSTISDNVGGFVGGIDPAGALEVRFSTISGNVGAQPTGTGNAGGIATDGPGTVTLDGVILSGNLLTDFLTVGESNCNSADVVEGPDPNLESADTCGLDTGAGNLINTDPFLAPLADNGGSTQTQGLYPGSPALDRAPGCLLSVDQRNVARSDGGCDLGAFEGTVPYPPKAPPLSLPTSTSPPASAPITKKKKKCKRRGKKRRCKKRSSRLS